MTTTPVYITDMGAAASVGGMRVGNAVILHDGLTVDQQGDLLTELLRSTDRPDFIYLSVPVPLAAVRSA